MTIASDIRAAVIAGRVSDAADLTGPLVEALTGKGVSSITFTSDAYALNSVSGRVAQNDGTELFFKFHVEDGEQDNVSEYYRASVLADAGLPVEVPVAISAEPGQQFVLYEIRNEPRMVDVCLDLDRSMGPTASLSAPIAAARRDLDRRIGEVLVETLHTDTSGGSSSLHQLFHHRLTDSVGAFPGGRYASWYLNDPAFTSVANAHWTINGTSYASTLAELVAQARDLMNPESFVGQPVVTAHGDDHHGNVWVIDAEGTPSLRLFDPAFAGTDVPALLALVKPTFHNVFAHPYWIYHPDEVLLSDVTVSRHGDEIDVTDPLSMSPMRQQILDSITQEAWLPLLRAMKDRDVLPSNWRAIVRSALFLCPFLVTNLVTPNRSELLRTVGLGHALATGSEPKSGSDPLTDMLDWLEGQVH
jgi:hypothetical protein